MSLKHLKGVRFPLGPLKKTNMSYLLQRTVQRMAKYSVSIKSEDKLPWWGQVLVYVGAVILGTIIAGIIILISKLF